MKLMRKKRLCFEIVSDNQEIFAFVSHFLDIQIFLKKIKCLSRKFNISIQKAFLQVNLKGVNLSLQNINLRYFKWQLRKFKNSIHFIKFFHTMNDSFLECLTSDNSTIQNLDLSYCREIKNVSLLRKLHQLETINLIGFLISEDDFLILKIINYLFKRESLKKVILSRKSESLIQSFIHENQSLKDVRSIFSYY